jgi:hypothetical protein
LPLRVMRQLLDARIISSGEARHVAFRGFEERD